MRDAEIEEFFQHWLARLAVGAREYGEESFRRPLTAILHEMEEEAVDIPGWGSIALASELGNPVSNPDAHREAYLEHHPTPRGHIPASVRDAILDAVYLSMAAWRRIHWARMQVQAQEGE